MQAFSYLKILKTTVVLFAATTLIFGVKYLELQSKNIKLKEMLILDKKTYINDLKEIFYRYDNELINNKKVKNTRQTIIGKKAIKINSIVLSTKRSAEINFPKNNIAVDSLKHLLQHQTENNINLSNQITILDYKNKELNQLNNQNEIIISSSKNLTAINVSAVGIKLYDDGMLETKKHANIDQIKVCFTLLENKAAVNGNKDLYIQIINPDKKVISTSEDVSKSKKALLDFSAKTNIFYDNETLDVCLFINPNKPDIIRGDYELNIYSGIHPIGSAIFYLK